MKKYKKFLELNKKEQEYLIKDLRKTLIETIVIEKILIPKVVKELALNIEIQENMIKENESIKHCNAKYINKLIDTSELTRDMFNIAVSKIKYEENKKKTLEYDEKINKYKKGLKFLKGKDYIPLSKELKKLEIEHINNKLNNTMEKYEKYKFKMNKYLKRVESW